MRKGGNNVVDPLAAIEDMLSSLCGAQSGGPVLPPNSFEDGTQQVPEEDIMHGQASTACAPIVDQEPATPEKRNSPKERPKKGRSRRQTRPNVSKQLPASNRVRKSRRERARKTSARRSDPKAAVPRDIDDDGGRQQDFDNKAADTRDIDDGGQQDYDYDLFGTSSDDRESAKVLNQMKRLAKEQLDVQKRKNNAMNENAVNAMKHQADQCNQKMKQIAGEISSDIINRATQIEEILPTNLTEQNAREMNIVKRETETFNDFQQSNANAFSDQVKELEQKLKMRRRGNKEKYEAKGREMFRNTKAACESGQRFTSVLEEIEKMLDL